MEMETTIGKLTANRRRDTGKSYARKLRVKGFIPAICYGKNSEPLSLEVDPIALRKALDPQKRQNTLIELAVHDGTNVEIRNVLLKNYQIDTIKRTVLHADFLQVKSDQIIDVSVPVTLEGKPEGLKFGGTIHQVFRTLPIKCMASKIPTTISLDISTLQIGDAIRVQDVTTLPEGVQINLPGNQSVVALVAPEKEREGVSAAEGTGEAAGQAAEVKSEAKGKEK